MHHMPCFSLLISIKADPSDFEQLSNIVRDLTGTKVADITLRDLPILEERKGRGNGTRTNGVAAVSTHTTPHMDSGS